MITDSDIRSACIQVLFSMVYHLKSAVLPYSSKILEASIRSLREESSDKVFQRFSLAHSLWFQFTSLAFLESLFISELRSSCYFVHQERMAGAKLLASLMASEEAVIESISVGLLESRALLHSLSVSDPSMDVRSMCQKLLACMTSPWIISSGLYDAWIRNIVWTSVAIECLQVNFLTCNLKIKIILFIFINCSLLSISYY